MKIKYLVKLWIFRNVMFLTVLNRINKSVENSSIDLLGLQKKSKRKSSVYLPLLKYDFEVHSRIHRLIQNLGSVPSSRVGQMIRFGSENDGGYSIIDDLNTEDVLISFGVGSDISFEKSIEHKIKEIHFYDYSVDSLPCHISNSRFFREKVGIGASEINISDALNKFQTTPDFLLKCDIEGSEWEILAHVELSDLLKFRQIVIEFHNLENLINLEDFLQMESVFSKLASTHQLISVQPNNYGEILTLGNVAIPSVFEATYYRKARAQDLQEKETGMDETVEHQNCLNRPPMGLGFPWM
jgi:hypothetical protein